MNDQEITARLRHFLAVQSNVSGRKIFLSTRVAEDLDIDGAHARRFVKALEEEFRLDMSGFVFEEYFSEKTSFFNTLLSLFEVKTPRNLKVITLSDLVEMVRAGKWLRTP